VLTFQVTESGGKKDDREFSGRGGSDEHCRGKCGVTAQVDRLKAEGTYSDLRVREFRVQEIQ
jgi:hypothetical protein